MQVLTIIGARPQIIKAAAFSRAVALWNANPVHEHLTEVILHTGQHYDDNMSAVFFRELGIPEPDVNLHVGSGSHGEQTARMIAGIEAVLQGRLPDGATSTSTTFAPFQGIVLYGDTNSTLAGAVAASKLHIPIYHIEAGLRSFNMSMPEEINRIVCDNLSHILFAPTQTAVDNLLREGFSLTNASVEPVRQFADGRSQKVLLSGDVMYDNACHFLSLAEKQCDILRKLNLSSKQFLLATIHRPSNTDSSDNLSFIFRALLAIAKGKDGLTPMTVVLPLHPRTRKLLPEKLSADLIKEIDSCPNIRIVPPASFFEILLLEKHASIVLTDSGGVQKEAFFLGTPCLIMREETEWVEIVDAGAGLLVGADYARIVDAYKQLLTYSVAFPPLFGDAHAAEHIVEHIMMGK